MTKENALWTAAKAARHHAHAPYSNYHVGAAVLDEGGDIHAGCNVENAAYPEGICAEANAIGSMITAGRKQIKTIAIVGGHAGDSLEDCTPCGGCRQKILEFADAETQILLEGAGGKISRYKMADLLPFSFRF
ncbi:MULTISPECIES: cytidine deaminase [unclassified Iodidimonas]|jgi:cytidine deaminase|uniref:cytidine deaminase n=1 Tax=unclassified Iodidimonas TaxID=2626145 RepID=UPI0024823E3C|nr:MULTISPECIES: cytidine deaminase [unclassified Iodidimonas]